MEIMTALYNLVAHFEKALALHVHKAFAIERGSLMLTYEDKVKLARFYGFKMDIDYDKNRDIRHVRNKPIRPWYMMFADAYNDEQVRLVHVSESYLFEMIGKQDVRADPEGDLLVLINDLHCKAANMLNLRVDNVRMVK
jgi:hypothetical protein